MAGEDAAQQPVLRVIEVRAGEEVVFYVYPEGVHIELRGAGNIPADNEADIGPKAMAALIQAWRKLHPSEQESGGDGG